MTASPSSDTQAGQIDIARFSLDNVSEVSMALGQAVIRCRVPVIMLRLVLSVETERPHFTDKGLCSLCVHVSVAGFRTG